MFINDQAQFKTLSGRCCKIYSHDRQITYSYLANGFRIAFWCEGFSMQAWNKLKKQLVRAYVTCKSLHAGAGSSLATSGSFRALFRCRPGSGMAQPRFALSNVWFDCWQGLPSANEWFDARDDSFWVARSRKSIDDCDRAARCIDVWDIFEPGRARSTWSE